MLGVKRHTRHTIQQRYKYERQGKSYAIFDYNLWREISNSRLLKCSRFSYCGFLVFSLGSIFYRCENCLMLAMLFSRCCSWISLNFILTSTFYPSWQNKSIVWNDFVKIYFWWIAFKLMPFSEMEIMRRPISY